MKTLIDKGSIEMLRLEISTCQTEDSHHCICSLVFLGLYRLTFLRYPPLPDQFSEKNLRARPKKTFPRQRKQKDYLLLPNIRPTLGRGQQSFFNKQQ